MCLQEAPCFSEETLAPALLLVAIQEKVLCKFKAQSCHFLLL